MKNQLGLALLLITIPTLLIGQIAVERNFDLELAEKDSVTSANIEHSLNAFLSEAQAYEYSENFSDSNHRNQYDFFFRKIAAIGKNSEDYHQPIVLKSYPIGNGSYRLTVGFTGVRNGNPFIFQITEFKAIPYKDHYRFYCTFEENTVALHQQSIDNVTYYYSQSFQKETAQKFVAFSQEFAQLTNGPKPTLNYYSFNSLDELLKAYGFLYSARQCNFLCYDLGFSENDGSTYITGTNNENYVFGYISNYVYYYLPNSDDVYWPFVNGIAAYYGGYGLDYDDMATLKDQFRKQLESTPDIDFYEEFSKGRKSAVARHFSYYVMSAFLFEEVLQQKGFENAFQLAYTGNDGDRFFEVLDQTIGVNKENFHETIVSIIEVDS
jgi:hypothetical protein